MLERLSKEFIIFVLLWQRNKSGPIIKLGKNPKDDEVIGIANFQLNILASTAIELNKLLANKTFLLELQKGVNLNLSEVLKLFAKSIIVSSNGVGGCVSINHFLQATQ